MACFLVPGAEAVVVTAVACGLKLKEKKSLERSVSRKCETADRFDEVKVSVSTKLMWLAKLLWGGCLLLCFEHVWHGEVAPWFPFLTAASDPASASVMLAEMRSVGGVMAITVTAAWALAMLAVKKIAGAKKAAAAA